MGNIYCLLHLPGCRALQTGEGLSLAFPVTSDNMEHEALAAPSLPAELGASELSPWESLSTVVTVGPSLLDSFVSCRGPLSSLGV